MCTCTCLYTGLHRCSWLPAPADSAPANSTHPVSVPGDSTLSDSAPADSTLPDSAPADSNPSRLRPSRLKPFQTPPQQIQPLVPPSKQPQLQQALPKQTQLLNRVQNPPQSACPVSSFAMATSLEQGPIIIQTIPSHSRKLTYAFHVLFFLAALMHITKLLVLL